MALAMKPFVGREAELDELRAASEAARSGQPRTILIEGEAGIGKSSLLARFSLGLRDAIVLRASGEETELWLAYGVVAQLVAGARGAGADPPTLLAEGVAEGRDAPAVGADLVRLLGDLQDAAQVVVVEIDDLHWTDSRSARALLFALRRLRADRVLVLLTARTGQVARLGEAWPRFVAGDPQAERIGLSGLSASELVALGAELGIGELSGSAVRTLLDHTGGNPLYCRALLEEVGPEGIARARAGLPAPRALADLIVHRLQSLTVPARQLVISAGTLGRRCELAFAGALAELTDPLPALAEAVEAEIIVERDGEISFVHPLVHSAVYEHLTPAGRRRLHARAAELVGAEDALRHRVAAAFGPDDRLASELEAAADVARGDGRVAQAGAWLARASSITASRGERNRLVLEAIATLLQCGEVAQAEALAPTAAAAERSARQAALLGELDLLAGRPLLAEARLTQAWETHDPSTEADVGAEAAAQLAMVCGIAGRIPEAISWARRVARAHGAAPLLRHRGQSVLAVGLCLEGRGREGLDQLAFLPGHPADVAAEDTDTLVRRGVVRLLLEDLDAAVGDLGTSATRLRAGVPLRYASQCLAYLAEAEYRRGDWDDAVVHGELAVTLAHDADRAWDFGYVHSFAASVPAGRGDWGVARAHVQAARQSAESLGTADTLTAAATAQARLSTAAEDPAGVLQACAVARATGRATWCGRPERYDWRLLEVGALLAVERLGEAADALDELEAVVAAGDPPSPPSAQVGAARLRGGLALARGDHIAAGKAFELAWRHAGGVRAPLPVALLEIADAQRLRAAGRRDRAIALLRSARSRVTMLSARPYVTRCDAELSACGARVAPAQEPGTVGLTRAERAVAALVAAGRTNRETAAELYVSTKTVEFHLGHIYAKLGIRSRRQLRAQLDGAPPATGGN